MIPSLKLTFTSIVLTTLLLAACQQKYNPDIEVGGGYNYRVGHPEMRLTAIGMYTEDGESVIEIAADVVYSSLIFKKNLKTDEYEADVSLEVTIYGGEEQVTYRKLYELSISNPDRNIVESQDRFLFEERIPVSPGRYKTDVVIIDNRSGKNTSRTLNTFIPSLDENVINLTTIQLSAKQTNDPEFNNYYPVTTYDVQSRTDSIRFQFQVTKTDPNKVIIVKTRLLEIASDMEVARPMYDTNLTIRHLHMLGIDYRRTKELATYTRRLQAETGPILIEFKYTTPPRGNYRFEVVLETQQGEEIYLKGRDFSVKPPNYPAVKSIEEMVEALLVFMDPKEHQERFSSKNPDTLKREFDRFWAENLKSKSKASDSIKLFYMRIEEANKQFSNFKEGWKTDMGFIYTLLGPPWYVEQFADRIRWVYGYNRDDINRVFIFRLVRQSSSSYPFDNYALIRYPEYYQVYYMIVQDWMSGRNLSNGYF